MTADTIPVAPLSIWKPVHLGTDELGRRVEVTLAERNMLIGGEPGGGKSVALQLIVAHGALSPDCRLILIDGKRVELGLWRDCAERFIGPSIDDAIDTLHWLQDQIDERTGWLLDHKMRKITPQPGLAGLPDARSTRSPTTRPPSAPPPSRRSSTPATATSSPAAGHPGIIPVEATQRPSADIIPTSLAGPVRLPVGVPLLHRSRPRTPSSATAGPTRATRPPRSTRKPAGCPGCGPRTASPAGSRPPTSPTSRSSTWPPGPPRPAPPTTPADHAGDCRQRGPAAPGR